MINIQTANTTSDLKGILELQKLNLSNNLQEEEKENQGFVTVNHTFEQLLNLNNIEKHIIAKNNDTVIGYVLAMTAKSEFDIPILVPMFKIFKETFFNNKLITNYNYIVVGQVCIDKSYRGQHLFDQCYQTYKEYYQDKYDFAITEIASKNIRSLNAHKRIGFEVIKTYTSSDNIEWVIVIWDWNKSNNNTQNLKRG